MGSAPPIFDGHNDVLSLYLPGRKPKRTFLERSSKGHLDLPRAEEGGFGGGLFAILAPSRGPSEPRPKRTSTESGWEVGTAPEVDHRRALHATFTAAAALFRISQESKGRVKVIINAEELETCIKEGVMAAVLHFEGAEAIDPELNALEVFYRAGLRSLGIVWSRPNAFAHGVPFKFPHSPDTGPGLTDAGKELVKACNQLGILVDLSHLNEKGFWDVTRLSSKPLVASHSNAHALCPITRNLTDRQLDAIRDSDGLVGVNFSVSFLRADAMKEADTPLAEIVRHVDYLVDRLGIDRVGFGSDFDGATIPNSLGDVSGLPKLMKELDAHGYDEESLRKLAHENWLRVLRLSWL